MRNLLVFQIEREAPFRRHTDGFFPPERIQHQSGIGEVGRNLHLSRTVIAQCHEDVRCHRSLQIIGKIETETLSCSVIQPGDIRLDVAAIVLATLENLLPIDLQRDTTKSQGTDDLHTVAVQIEGQGPIGDILVEKEIGERNVRKRAIGGKLDLCELQICQ